MVYRLLQVDPETAAIHVNLSEIQRHPSNGAFLSAIAHFTAGNLHGRITELLRAAPGIERAREVSMLSHLVHEARHHFDMIMTPFGFYRIRAAFEFYALAPHLLAEDAPRTLFPLALNLDEFYCRLHSVGPSGAVLEALFRLVRNRHDIILADNRKERLADGTLVGTGGDAIMEALAFSAGVEFVHHLFDDPWVRRIHPIAFDGNHGPQLQATYAWHFSLARLLEQEPRVGTMRLVVTMMFAALCGSTARDAKIRVVAAGARDHEDSSRDVTASLPSQRLDKLVRHFADQAESRSFGSMSVDEVVGCVEKACRELFGLGFLEEIQADIEADEALVDAWGKGASEFPVKAFADLLTYRKYLAEHFLADPNEFLSPVNFIAAFDRHCRPAVLGCSPMGSLVRNDDDMENVLVDRFVATPEPILAAIGHKTEEGKAYANRGVLIELLPRLSDEEVFSHLDQWKSIWGFFSPLYKMGLYGACCRTLTEAEVVVVRDYLIGNHPNIVLEPFFDRPNDVSSPVDYFLFHELSTAECDVCGHDCQVDEMRWVSARTFHLNRDARQHWLDQFDEFTRQVAVWRFDMDFSGWKLCTACVRQLGFTP